MGTQQILLIVLSVIIVGAAIAVGIQMFNNQAYSSNKSAIAAVAQTYATQIVQLYKTPVWKGGLGGDVTTATVDLIHNYHSCETTEYKSESGQFIVNIDDNEVVISGLGNAERGSNNPKVVTTVAFPEGKISAVLSDEPVPED